MSKRIVVLMMIVEMTMAGLLIHNAVKIYSIEKNLAEMSCRK